MQLIDRLAYALIGAIAGAVVAFLVGWMLGFGVWPRGSLSFRGAGLLTTMKYMAVSGGIVGFIWKEKVGDVAGSVIQMVFQIRTGEADSDNAWHVPFWVKLLFLAAVAFAVWRFA